MDGTCARCGSAFSTFTTVPKRYCSNRCMKKAAKERRDAAKRGVFVEEVWRPVVYERDGFICQICHRPVKMAAKVPHPKAPTLDHIIPLAAGGTHEYANVQLAHFACNVRKGIGGGQLALNLAG